MGRCTQAHSPRAPVALERLRYIFFCGIINKTVQIQMAGLDIESTVSLPRNTFHTGEWVIEAVIPVIASLRQGTCRLTPDSLLPSFVFFQAKNAPQPFSAGPRWGSLRRSPRPLNRLGMGTLFCHFFLHSTPFASREGAPSALGPRVPRVLRRLLCILLA